MATHIRAISTEGPTYSPSGQYLHRIRWETNGRDGFIIQHIERHEVYVGGGNDLRVEDEYWEAWWVDGADLVSPRASVPVLWNDTFSTANAIPGTFIARNAVSRGHWRMKGTVYWARLDRFDLNSWNKTAMPGQGGGAGKLYQRANRPTFALGHVYLRRNEAGEWDGTANPAVAHRARVFGSKL